ncbi:MAG: hypothetical protein A3G52_04215 [Candidatus Taylorbacteria bacterium RIFCSPLOWO2_12_FULL_43_20]|uniref:N-end rule aminoacyl transferase C-terminal domain-containing protein n=1 Tax=Candidatus Taylorbacteria bacterium RIFCSPLOWO2_12_FULL_43_20 TaxID=1802332 RepID=A0A1G2P094_9BACT|nr:MAG: hypothetical protein A2825_01350 [Candidatus Taylorbacteria bacterium RIFCSPHIGHO2_01_FULL_43_120]OHA22488.1 MAG: hypothetical protein A3B98_00860 [Candidatus Taylorbacteria bacterium RIFCSPHIGHO2_02_FULL_43_55]OHA28378.1 MAG: hypothetical protein A3E92_01650 [Candidatus Taylorbacteria bacterium RIFCSPHIGHO2_12_FULL_42_34]OHA30499.1 MAG: hypothetical protein A3B09_00615 [Candidatus Taylorbacteria bacterium RIFCSPLOWO2_01_FULL_43_83]OHA38083.1 MAG: hypothetical protein A3H58_01720 [Candi
MSYLSWNTKILPDFSDESMENLYDEGYIFTRIGKGYFTQTRSLRIDLSKFELSSENRRILRKMENIKMELIPLPYENYHWSIHKLAKDFYSKFGDNIFSANKVKELLTDPEKSNFNRLITFTQDIHESSGNAAEQAETLGYCVALETKKILHYSYPFYKGSEKNPSFGLGMMTKAIMWAKENGKKYIYLGSLQRPSDTYKLQFSGSEWFDGKAWSNDFSEIAKILKQ